jgi:hemin uptake protein HemP
MTYPRRADANQAAIVLALRKLGYSVQHLHTVGGGCPDIVVGHEGKNYLFEIKTRGGKLTQDESIFHEVWRGQVNVIYRVEDALAIMAGSGEK